MNIHFYLEKLHSSDEFKKFIQENPDAFLCSGFFVSDKEEIKKPDNRVHLDFYSPKNEKAFSFDMTEGIKILPLENFSKGPDKISEDIEIDFEEMEKLISEKMKEENVNSKIQKILFSLQNDSKKDFLTAIIFISMLGILKATIDLPEKKVRDFEKKSFMDMFKVVKKEKKD